MLDILKMACTVCQGSQASDQQIQVSNASGGPETAQNMSIVCTTWWLLSCKVMKQGPLAEAAGTTNLRRATPVKF
jgi:hypothetical protein